ncbi:F-box/kelch-repeat protein At3g06240-like [Rhododendron vialii]|uniref:F-box/kelch-repeat protein At3g06240-like n=1 Tax=Rhododendron vialii TaxID=182163 RepID=UPI00265E813A|nr:F-box/kelch-repeat protein At3g06240-like [Rhododendron vialii]
MKVKSSTTMNSCLTRRDKGSHPASVAAVNLAHAYLRSIVFFNYNNDVSHYKPKSSSSCCSIRTLFVAVVSVSTTLDCFTSFLSLFSNLLLPFGEKLDLTVMRAFGENWTEQSTTMDPSPFCFDGWSCPVHNSRPIKFEASTWVLQFLLNSKVDTETLWREMRKALSKPTRRRRRRGAMAGSQSAVARATFHLPLEITTEILSRLPVKSLLRFKSVCKTWYDLIKTPDFISKHLQTHSTINSTSLLVTKYNRKTQEHAMSLVFNDGFHSNGPISLDFPFLNRMPSLRSCEYSRGDYFYIGGICNGLVCISLSPFGYPLILCNPATRQFQEIPNSEWKWLDDHVEIIQVSFGFGYHPGGNDYKLIRIVLYSSLMEEDSFKADVYVMRTGTWREIDADKVSGFLGEKDNLGRLGSYVLIDGFCASAVLNGVFYWTACVMSTNETCVMSFDMGDEVFRRIRMPVCLDGRWDETNWWIAELKDELALVINFDDRHIDLWVLNEDHSSWTNQFKVGCFPRIERYVGYGETTVVGGSKNGELVVTKHEVCGDLKLFLYDLNTRETMDFHFGRVPYPSDIYLYTGTLLPLPVVETNEVVKRWWN